MVLPAQIHPAGHCAARLGRRCGRKAIRGVMGIPDSATLHPGYDFFLAHAEARPGTATHGLALVLPVPLHPAGHCSTQLGRRRGRRTVRGVMGIRDSDALHPGYDFYDFERP